MGTNREAPLFDDDNDNNDDTSIAILLLGRIYMAPIRLSVVEVKPKPGVELITNSCSELVRRGTGWAQPPWMMALCRERPRAVNRSFIL